MKAVLITSSILIVLIAALRPVLRGKIAPKVQYALWLVAALRLLVPVNLAASAYSALALLERVDDPAPIVSTIGQTAIPVQSYDDARAQVVQEYVRQGVPETSFTPADLTAIDRQAQELMRGPTVGEIAAKLAKPIWLTGAALMAGWFLLVNAKLRRKLRGAKRLNGVHCPLPVYVSDALPSPCLCGAVRPKIYVTPAAVADPDRLRHVLAHELTHYRHRDHWWAVLRCACLCVYWFDPLVWWAAALSRQDCELACDEGAIRALGEGERIPYGRTLVAMIAAGRNPLLQTATTMTGGKRRVRERVKLIARRPKTVIVVAVALVLIIACAVGCTFTGAPEGSPEPDASPSVSSAPDAPRPTLDTLVERLDDIPEELRDKVDTSADNSEPEALATYWLNDPKWKDLWSGYLLTLYRLDEARIREKLDNQLWPAVDIFARSGDEYYALIWPDDGRYQDDDALGEEYWGAVNTVKDYVKEAVLQTDGVEPFDPYTDPPHFFSIADRPTPEQQAIQAVMDAIISADGISLTLAPAGTSRLYAYAIPSLEEWDATQGYWAYRLETFATNFQWEKLDALPEGMNDTTLMIQPEDSLSCIWLWDAFNMAAIRTPDNRIEYYQAVSNSYGDPLGTSLWNPSPYGYLRQWFDEVELSRLRTNSVPDRGQSHEDVVAEWIEGFEGAMAKCAPGSIYACTYTRAENVQADAHSFMSKEDMDDFAQSRGYVGEDYGKTWFTFSYELVFVPENENARDYMQAGNTADYAGDGAPEGAQFFMRVAYMELVDGSWVCEGTGTGW